MSASRRADAADPHTRAILTLARQVVESRGNITDQQLSAARASGITDAELAETIAHVALNILTNYINIVARTEVDFPVVALAG
jgi:alkylhydroperoxidase family enzyme